MRVLIVSMAAAGLMSACTTTAMESTPATGVAEAAAGEKICKKETVIGSNMPQRTCLTQAEWDARERAGLKDVDDFKRRQSEISAVNN